MKNEKCFKCGNLKRYYTKGVKQYDKTKFGWCGEKKEIVSACGGCEKYRTKRAHRPPQRFLRRYLQDLLTEITELRKVVQEVEDESKENGEV